MSTISTSINSMSELQAAILLLEHRQHEQGDDLRDWFRQTYQSMRPMNLIKNALTDVVGSEDIKEHLVSTGVGLVAGHASKAVYQKVSDNPLKGLLGVALQIGVTKVVTRNPELVLSVGRGLFTLIRGAWRAARENREEEPESEETTHPDPETVHHHSI